MTKNLGSSYRAKISWPLPRMDPAYSVYALGAKAATPIDNGWMQSSEPPRSGPNGLCTHDGSTGRGSPGENKHHRHDLLPLRTDLSIGRYNRL